MFDLNDVAAQALKKQVEDAVSDRIDNLEVIVKGTEVTIRGEVETADDKEEALALVQDIEGISKIISGITVNEEEEEEYDEEEEGDEDVYVVQPGDTLWGIAQEQLGNGALYMEIYNANKAVIGSNPDLIKVGMELVIPR
jgi:nucleoid-associated protein YgaU